MKLGIVVTTLGRVDALRRLLVSLDGQLVAGDRLVLVAQARADEVERLVATEHPGLEPFTTVTTSERGASLGRNTGVAALPDGELLLCFPNDTTWFPAESLERLRTRADGLNLQAGAMTVVDEEGPKFVLPSPGTRLDRWNVWSVIEMGLLVRRSVFDAVGGFDVAIGTGASTPWQAGEATDFLLRLAAARPELVSAFAWLPSDIAVGGVADPHGLTAPERRRKLRAYGRGLGRLVVVHRYPWWWRAAFVAGGVLFGVRHPAGHHPLDGWWVFVGRFEGILGRTFGRGSQTAVSR